MKCVKCYLPIIGKRVFTPKGPMCEQCAKNDGTVEIKRNPNEVVN